MLIAEGRALAVRSRLLFEAGRSEEAAADRAGAEWIHDRIPAKKLVEVLGEAYPPFSGSTTRRPPSGCAATMVTTMTRRSFGGWPAARAAAAAFEGGFLPEAASNATSPVPTGGSMRSNRGSRAIRDEPTPIIGG